MRVLLAVFACGLRRYSTYRVATLSSIVVNGVFGAVNAMVLLAVFDARPRINGYTAEDAVTQVFLAQSLIGITAIFGPPLDLGGRIRDGQVAMDLLRPVGFVRWWLAQDLGRAAFALLSRTAPTFAVGLALFDLALPADPLRWAALAAAVALAVLVGFGLRYLYALAGFWLMDTRGVNAVAWLAGPFCSGMVLPLVLFPDPVAAVLRTLPWAALVQVPAEILLGRTVLPGGAAGGLAYQAVWAALLLALGAALTARATRRVVVQGG
ncbi:ABC transporter permease [Actinorugispora endophytica]|uniref:ABC-2 type transport system permease protein n=1 Tax=Actinorugispora endophytica TaxID=1605990 RepID=A0A4R6V0D0_9ACTN|nr:ABC-2 family transporter protein [Actinorugispora endophytica]TDQ53360.1 ABC-2 type transport system permease protein [Actinorugispora endophytica]